LISLEVESSCPVIVYTGIIRHLDFPYSFRHICFARLGIVV